MTIFSDNPHDRRIERFMTAIPNIKPRGVGVRFSESQVLITITAATPTEILAETMRQIRCPPFRKRFNEYTPFVRDYDGQNFPAYVYDQMLCFLRAEYNGKTEFLYLPCEEEAIDKAFARLGAPTPDDVELSWEDICIDSDKWVGRFKEIAAEEGVYELNRLAATVNNADIDLEKLWAVAELTIRAGLQNEPTHK